MAESIKFTATEALDGTVRYEWQHGTDQYAITWNPPKRTLRMEYVNEEGEYREAPVLGNYPKTADAALGAVKEYIESVRWEDLRKLPTKPRP